MNVADLAAIVQRVSAGEKMSSSDVEDILHVQFSSSVLCAGGFTVERKVEVSGGSLRTVIFKHSSDPREAETDWLLSLRVAPGLQITEDELRRHLPFLSPGPVDINPDIAPEGTVTFEINEPHQTNLFSFRYRSRLLYDVVMRRPSDGQTTVIQHAWP